jgi:hypothetical protein
MGNNLKSSILLLRKENKTINEIVSILGCAKSTVSFHINNNNLGGNLVSKLKENLEVSDNDFIKDLDGEIVDEVVNLKKDGYTYKHIFSEVNISQDKIKRICRIYGINRVNHRLKFDDPDFNKKIINLYDEIGNIKKVCKILKIGYFSVRNIIEIKSKKNIEVDEEQKNKLNVERVHNHRKNRKKELVEYKGGCCEKCGYNKSLNALQFHHINPNDKDFTIGGKNYTFERMKKEVDKCILVCSNCHAEIHDTEL